MTRLPLSPTSFPNVPYVIVVPFSSYSCPNVSNPTSRQQWFPLSNETSPDLIEFQVETSLKLIFLVNSLLSGMGDVLCVCDNPFLVETVRFAKSNATYYILSHMEEFWQQIDGIMTYTNHRKFSLAELYHQTTENDKWNILFWKIVVKVWIILWVS